MYCSNCGKPIYKNAVFCSECGEKTNQEQAQINNPAQMYHQQNVSSDKQNILAVIGFAIACVLLIDSMLIHLVSGIIALVLSTLGLVLSIVGLVQINNDNERGKGFAIVGIAIAFYEFIRFLMLFFKL